MKVENFDFTVWEGGHNCNGSVIVTADTPLGFFQYERETPMDDQLDGGLDVSIKLGERTIDSEELCFEENEDNADAQTKLEAFLDTIQ